MARKLVAEFIGTFLLVFLAVGAAVVALKAPNDTLPASGVLGVALAFGLVLVVIAYAFGPVSGGHVNPAVSLAMVMTRRMEPGELLPYWAAQFAGAVTGAALLKLLVTNFGVFDTTGDLGANKFLPATGAGGAFLVEVVLTFAFVLVILLVTDASANAGFAGLALGLSLATVHLVGIPIDGTSVNPARSFGPAIFTGGDALSQLWVFLLAPLVGGILAALAYSFTRADDFSPVGGSPRD